MSLLTRFRLRKSNVDQAVQYGPDSLGGGHYVTEWWVDDDPTRWVKLVSTPEMLRVTSANHFWLTLPIATDLPVDADPTDVINEYLEEL